MERVSSADIARVVGVSRATVSYVLNDRPGRRISQTTRNRILETAQSLGYVPNPVAIALRSGQSKIVLLRENTKLPPLGGEILPVGSMGGILRDSITRQVRSWGMTLVSFGVDSPLSEVLAHLTPCLLLAPSGLTDEDAVTVRQAGIPWVGSPPGSMGDDDLMSKLLTRIQVLHLQEKGHVKIGYINSNIAELKDLAEQREQGILDACKASAVVCSHRVRLGMIDEALQSCLEILPQWRKDGVTAVACFNDLYAGAALKAARMLGWPVPNSLAVIGVDDSPFASLLDPPLTSVRLNMADLGGYVAASGRAALDGVSLPPIPDGLTPLVVRSST